MWVSSHVAISGNERADQEAKNATSDLNLAIHNDAVPHTDARHVIRKLF